MLVFGGGKPVGIYLLPQVLNRLGHGSPAFKDRVGCGRQLYQKAALRKVLKAVAAPLYRNSVGKAVILRLVVITNAEHAHGTAVLSKPLYQAILGFFLPELGNSL
jgi:hypothetical protein